MWAPFVVKVKKHNTYLKDLFLGFCTKAQWKKGSASFTHYNDHTVSLNYQLSFRHIRLELLGCHFLATKHTRQTASFSHEHVIFHHIYLQNISSSSSLSNFYVPYFPQYHLYTSHHQPTYCSFNCTASTEVFKRRSQLCSLVFIRTLPPRFDNGTVWAGSGEPSPRTPTVLRGPCCPSCAHWHS